MRFIKGLRRVFKKQYDFRTFLLFLAFFTVGVVLLLWVCFLDKHVDVTHFRIIKWSTPKPIVINILSQFSGTFFVIAVLIVTVEKIFKVFLKKDIDVYSVQIAESVHDAIYGNFVPEEILSEVKQQVILSAFVYRNYNTEYVAEEVREISGQKYLKFSSELVMTVENISELTRQFKGVLEYTSAEFEKSSKPIEHELLEVRSKNRTIFKFNPSQCKSIVKRTEEGDKYLFPYEVPIPPEESVEVRMHRTLYLKDEGDAIDIFVKKPLINMDVRIVFPNRNYKLFYYPNLPNLKKHRKNFFKKEEKHQGKDIRISYKGGMLPYQGVVLQWKKIN